MLPERRVLQWETVSRARRLMKQGHDLRQAANALDQTAPDLDVSLWRNLGKRLPDEGR